MNLLNLLNCWKAEKCDCFGEMAWQQHVLKELWQSFRNAAPPWGRHRQTDSTKRQRGVTDTLHDAADHSEVQMFEGEPERSGAEEHLELIDIQTGWTQTKHTHCRSRVTYQPWSMHQHIQTHVVWAERCLVKSHYHVNSFWNGIKTKPGLVCEEAALITTTSLTVADGKHKGETLLQKQAACWERTDHGGRWTAEAEEVYIGFQESFIFPHKYPDCRVTQSSSL